MNYCKKCGNELKDNTKFCPNCGTASDSKAAVDRDSEINKGKKKSLKILFICIIFVILFLTAAGFAYIKMQANSKGNIEKSIEVLNVDIDKYPEITVSIKVNNYENKLNIKNVTIKEDDAFQKDLKLSDGVDSNQYKISYKTSDETSSSEKKIKVACVLDDKEYTGEYSYNPPEKKQTSSKKSNSNNAVSTYDNNEIKVKNALEDYEKAYIKMVNHKNIDYVKDSIDLSGGLVSEFTALIKSYSDQNITEDLMNHSIENIKKINDSDYEVTAYEKYYIYYGKDKKYSYIDFKDTYIVRLTNSGFKVYAIKSTDKISEKQTP